MRWVSTRWRPSRVWWLLGSGRLRLSHNLFNMVHNILTRPTYGRFTIVARFSVIDCVTQQVGGAQLVADAVEGGEVGPGRGSGVATGRFPGPPARTRRAALTAPGSPRALIAGQPPVVAAAGLGVHGVAMVVPR